MVVPADVGFRQILVTGPPGSGKSTLITRLGGWPEEGYLDLGDPGWWRSRILTFRPREVHLGIPIAGRRESFSVFDREWLENPLEIDVERILIPPTRRGLFSVDWRRRYAFDFQLVSAETVFTVRRGQARSLHRLEDLTVTLEMVERQRAAYAAVALYLHRNGVPVYLRESFEGRPRHFASSG